MCSCRQGASRCLQRQAHGRAAVFLRFIRKTKMKTTVIIMLLALCGWLYVSNDSLKTENSKQSKTISQLQSTINSQASQIMAMINVPDAPKKSWIQERIENRNSTLDAGAYDQHSSVSSAPPFIGYTSQGAVRNPTIYTDQYGRRYWVDAQGVRHYVQ